MVELVKGKKGRKTIEILKRATIGALMRAYDVHLALGEKGKDLTGETNEFGNQTFKADIEAGRAVFESLRKSEISIVISSEEHGREIIIGNNPQFLGVIDELDGSKTYKEGTGRYGTMFAIFNGLNPTYQDYLVSAILDYKNKQIYLASKGKGAWILKMDNLDRIPIQTSRVTSLDPATTRIRIDGGFKENIDFFAKRLKNFRNSFISISGLGGSSCDDFMSLADGGIDLVLQSTRKRNLEIAVAYGLVKEAGGVMVDSEGDDLRKRKYLEFGQRDKERFPVVSAASSYLAKLLLEQIQYGK